MSERNIYKDVLFGVAVGDALGVPVEFRSREELRKDPVIGMRGYGTHQQPPGTFSDDSSLTFCLAEALTEGFDLHTIGQNFVRWHRKGFWSAHGKIFDIGGITWRAISRIQSGVDPEMAGDDGDWIAAWRSADRIADSVIVDTLSRFDDGNLREVDFDHRDRNPTFVDGIL